MRPTRIGDLAFRGLLNFIGASRVSDNAWSDVDVLAEVTEFLDEEAKARGFDDWTDAFDEFRTHSEIANEATLFDELVKERAIAMKALRKIDALSMNGTTEQSSLNGHLAVNTAHNALDEIGDDRISDLE